MRALRKSQGVSLASSSHVEFVLVLEGRCVRYPVDPLFAKAAIGGHLHQMTTILPIGPHCGRSMTEFLGYRYAKLNSRMELDDMRFQIATILIVLAAPAYAGQTVRATWYGHELAGNRTASGERFNPNGLTAAHRSLPFGTCLRVGNPKDGPQRFRPCQRSGTFHEGRIAGPFPWCCPGDRHAFHSECDGEQMLESTGFFLATAPWTPSPPHFVTRRAQRRSSRTGHNGLRSIPLVAALGTRKFPL